MAKYCKKQAKLNAPKIDKAYEYVVKRLKAEGCVLMVYKAMTTNSIYVKIDDGVAGTLRISDHEGKKHLSYTYNLVLGSRMAYVNDNSISRWYAPFGNIVEMVDKILERRAARQRMYGTTYKQYMDVNRAKGNSKFWMAAEYI